MKNTYPLTVAGKAYEIDWAALPQASQEAIIAYGCQRFVNDRANTGGKEALPEHKQGVAEKVLEQLAAGWTGRIAAPKRSDFDKVAEDMLRLALRAKGTNKKALGEEKYSAVLDGFKTKYAKQIQAEVAKRAAALDLDLGDVFGDE